MEEAHILVVDDDEIVARTIERSLRAGGFQVSVVHSGVEALQTARRNHPDLLVLDVLMPGMDGYEVCRQIRKDPILEELPVLFLTAKGKEEDRIMGLRAGADDYLSKPFNLDELFLRVRAILRRVKKQDNAATEKVVTLKVREYELDARSFQVAGPRGKVSLTPVQFDLIYHLMSHSGEVFSPDRLLQEVWDYPHDTGSPDLVRVHIKNLRAKIERDPSSPEFIETVKGHGYTVMPEDS
ncbi:MAG: response regulator transcription factor [Anaerolineales bacterium]|nr:response regulator transcription factor [Anaerolineales bacterium]